MIKMLERNMKIKRAPQKWQHELVEMFDVAITFEKRVFDQVRMHSFILPAAIFLCIINSKITVPTHRLSFEIHPIALKLLTNSNPQLVDDMQSRTQQTLRPLLVVNMDVKDSHEESLIAAPQALRLCQLLQDGGETWEDQIDAVMDTFEAETGRRPLYQLCFY